MPEVFCSKNMKRYFDYISGKKAVGPSCTDSSSVKNSLKLHHILKLFFLRSQEESVQNVLGNVLQCAY